jgi:hypothetical protein
MNASRLLRLVLFLAVFGATVHLAPRVEAFTETLVVVIVP